MSLGAAWNAEADYKKMNFEILTLFPAFFRSPLGESIIGNAIKEGTLSVKTTDIRDFAEDAHRTIDDAPYGGGPGMVMKVGPVVGAIEATRSATGAATEGATEGTTLATGGLSADIGELVILATPQGEPFTQELALRLSSLKRLIIVCGRYEGFDERIRDYVDMEISIGDYVLTGGEAAALTIVDAVGRLVPGVLGDKASIESESFSTPRGEVADNDLIGAEAGAPSANPQVGGLLEYPHYTRPREFRGAVVPDVLTSGDHGVIKRWRRKESLRRTLRRRPDLMENAELSIEDCELIREIKGRP